MRCEFRPAVRRAALARAGYRCEQCGSRERLEPASHRQSAGSLSLQCHGPIRSVSRQATRRSPQSLRRTATTTSVVRTAGLTVRSRTNAVQYEGTEFLSNLKGTGGVVRIYHPPRPRGARCNRPRTRRKFRCWSKQSLKNLAENLTGCVVQRSGVNRVSPRFLWRSCPTTSVNPASANTVVRASGANAIPRRCRPVFVVITSSADCKGTAVTTWLRLFARAA